MKRIIAIIICVVILCAQIGVYSAWTAEEDGYETRYYPQLYKLQSLKVIPKDDEHTATSFVTRREVIEAAYTLYFAVRPRKSSKDDYLAAEWIDVNPNTYDAYILNNVYQLGFFTGKTDENGNLYADLDSYVTCEEAVLIMLRTLNCNNFPIEYKNFDVYIEKYAKEKGWLENKILLFAQECGLINYTALYDDRVFMVPFLDLQKATEPMMFVYFVGVIDRALYMPIWNGFHGSEPSYLIDQLTESAKYNDEE